MLKNKTILQIVPALDNGGVERGVVEISNFIIESNCKSIVQPKGSMNDKKVIDLANKNKISLFFTNLRFFKH